MKVSTNNNKLWREISQYFNFPPSTSPSIILYGLKSIYNRYLYAYEQAFFQTSTSNTSKKENNNNNHSQHSNKTITEINLSQDKDMNPGSTFSNLVDSSQKLPPQFTALMENIPQVFHTRNFNYIRSPIPIFSKRLRTDSGNNIILTLLFLLTKFDTYFSLFI